MKILLSVALASLILLAACGDDEEDAGETPSSPTQTASDASRTASPTATRATASPTPDPLAAVCADNPDPTTDDMNRVDTPSSGDAVSSPVTVSGEIAAFEATFRITIFDAAGETIADKQGMSAEGQTLAPFTEFVPFSVDEDTPACIWVYESSARDGEPVNVVQIPVTLEPQGTSP